ncbi:protein FATTY ACID EXPORT 1, chloroplastic-like [Rutidosis leptorrhynchoides]|uniref:protein FATTY ACID EXPORT 1, chloroplastic-like n=1 Tax=Rutidosis leptorrhynchoides TaxID=125765 RepID=UPI003A9A30EA
MSATTSQLTCFATIQNNFHLANRSHPTLIPSQLPVFMNSDRHVVATFSSNRKSAVKYITMTSKSENDILENPNSSMEERVNGEIVDGQVEKVVIEPKRAAKIHDFCFGIPYGGIVFSGGLVGFLFTKNPASLMTGGLYGGALLALSVFSLKVWGKGRSSLPFILGQAGIAAALLWKNMQTYSSTKKILPTGFNIVISAAMLCFYAYVVVSGGNPPPKKLKSAAATAAATS